MPSWGAPALRERFDDARLLAPTARPFTHRCDRYLATDGAMRGRNAGFGAILESPDGDVLAQWRTRGLARDNNDAELRALHYGLDRLAAMAPMPGRIGILLDHDALALGIATCVNDPVRAPVRPPMSGASPHHWGGVRARLARMDAVHVALTSGSDNPAHRLANTVAAD